jgi:hypothetical protein
MVLKRNLMIIVQSASTGLSRAQIIDQQNASSGMWAFGEGLEVIYLAALFYLLWPSSSTSQPASFARLPQPRHNHCSYPAAPNPSLPPQSNMDSPSPLPATFSSRAR